MFVWCYKDSTGISFTTAYSGEKIKSQIKRQANRELPVSPKVGLGNNCLMPNAYDAVPTSHADKIELNKSTNTWFKKYLFNLSISKLCSKKKKT